MQYDIDDVMINKYEILNDKKTSKERNYLILYKGY